MAGLPVKLQLIGPLPMIQRRYLIFQKLNFYLLHRLPARFHFFSTMTCHFPFPLVMQAVLNFVLAIAKSFSVIFDPLEELKRSDLPAAKRRGKGKQKGKRGGNGEGEGEG